MRSIFKKRIAVASSALAVAIPFAVGASAAEGETVSMGASIVKTVVDAVQAFLTGIGNSIVDLFDGIVISSTGGLTNFATWALVFLGVGLASGVIAAVLRKVG